MHAGFPTSQGPYRAGLTFRRPALRAWKVGTIYWLQVHPAYVPTSLDSLEHVVSGKKA